jgi:hypothetical protein
MYVLQYLYIYKYITSSIAIIQKRPTRAVQTIDELAVVARNPLHMMGISPVVGFNERDTPQNVRLLVAFMGDPAMGPYSAFCLYENPKHRRWT